jgi:hypothetical protein
MPSELSGGQQQRVAVARALVLEPGCCCSTSRSPTSTPSCAGACARRSASCSRAQSHRGLRHARPGGGARRLRPDHRDERTRRSRRAARRASSTTQPATRFVADFIGGANMVDCEIGSSSPSVPTRRSCRPIRSPAASRAASRRPPISASSASTRSRRPSAICSSSSAVVRRSVRSARWLGSASERMASSSCRRSAEDSAEPRKRPREPWGSPGRDVQGQGSLGWAGQPGMTSPYATAGGRDVRYRTLRGSCLQLLVRRPRLVSPPDPRPAGDDQPDARDAAEHPDSGARPRPDEEQPGHGADAGGHG